MKKIIRRISSFLLIGYVGMGVFLYLNQRDMLYFPTPHMETSYATMTLHNEGESINVIVLNNGYANAILYFGGNAESMPRSADEIARQFPKSTVYLMEYRGYGGSSGKPTEKGLYNDALKLYDSIKFKHQSISIGGRSLGSGIATYVAAYRDVAKLVLITPFDSIENVASGMYPAFPISLLLEDVYDSKSRIKRIKAKTLIVMAEHDRVIVRERTQQLIDAFKPGEFEILVIKNRGHNDLSYDPTYYKTIQDFIEER